MIHDRFSHFKAQINPFHLNCYARKLSFEHDSKGPDLPVHLLRAEWDLLSKYKGLILSLEVRKPLFSISDPVNSYQSAQLLRLVRC